MTGATAFDKQVAAHYEAWYETREGQRADALEKESLRRLLAHFPGAQDVLEVGCGTGHFTRWLDRQGLTPVGLDLSAAMLSEAEAINRVILMQGDAHRLPFANGAFDLTDRARGERGYTIWHTTLFPRWVPWEHANLLWGGFIGMALVLPDRL